MSTQKKITIRLTNDVYSTSKKYHPYVCRREQHIMLNVKKRQRVASPDTTELTRQIIVQLAPQMKRRASAHHAPSLSIETQPVQPARTTSKQSRTPLFLFAGFLCGLLLIVLGIIVMNWIDGVITHWHEGDSYVSTLDSDVGHGGGISHFLTFYRNGYVIVIEFNQDYSKGRTYTMKTIGLGTEPHSIQIDTQIIDGKRDLVLHIDDNQTIGYVFYNTGDAFRTTVQP